MAKMTPDTTDRYTRQPTMVAASMQMLGIADTACDNARTSSVSVAINLCMPRRSRCSRGADTTPVLSLARKR